MFRKKLYSAEDRRRYAARRMPRIIFDALDGAAGRETARRKNTQAFEEVFLQSRVLVNVQNRSLDMNLLGDHWQIPFGIAPMGMCDLFWPGADKMFAEAARDFGFPLGVSTMASTPLEKIFDWADGNAWFQLYAGESDEVTFSLVERAQKAGYSTLILTADVPVLPSRPRDYRNGFAVPFKMTPQHLIDFATHPRWSLTTLMRGVPKPVNISEQTALRRLPQFKRESGRDRIDWNFLSTLRDAWRGRLILKGVMSPDDAVRALSTGADAVYVSNHGGRQLESAPPAIKMLPIIREAVGPSAPLIFDSGVRSGDDIVCALASGANFVMLGRPMLYALADRGSAGLHEFLKLLIDDVSIVMAQIGCRSPSEVDAGCLAP
ncbi:MAG: alpha-hydroxy acid oxidase [Gammaproteobacteria bacterium]